MNVNVIIFDFDGTIADTLDAIVSITNRLAVEFGYKQTTQEELAVIRSLSSREIIKRSGVSIFKLPFLIRKVQAELNDEIQEIRPIPGIKEALIELKGQGNRLGIITSNSKQNVTTFLDVNGLQDLFNFTASGRIFGKNIIINRLLREEAIDPKAVIYIGDETRDIEAARKSHIKVISVSWGFNSKAVLAEQNPDFLIDRPREIVEIIEMLQEQVLEAKGKG